MKFRATVKHKFFTGQRVYEFETAHWGTASKDVMPIIGPDEVLIGVISNADFELFKHLYNQD